jgi:hypothetical protein
MRQSLTLLLEAWMILTAVSSLAAQRKHAEEEAALKPPEAISVTDIMVPIAGSGTVVLEAVVTGRGKLQKVDVRRDVPTLTPLAVQAVEDWKFLPATLAGRIIVARIPVAVTFRPPGYAAVVPLPPLIPQSEAAIQAAFQPAEITRAAFPKYPDNTVVSGAVILEARLSENGEVEELKVLRDLPPLTDEARIAAKDFHFVPAAYNGSSVRSTAMLAFVSQPVPVTSSLSSSGGPDYGRLRGW